QLGTGNPTPTGDIVARYEFNETAGSTAADSSGYGQQASVNSGTWAAGRKGNALYFNGTDTYASLPFGIVSSLNDFTIAAWVRVNTHNGWARLFDFGAGTDRYMFLTPKAEGTGMRFAITVSGNGEEQQLNAPELAAGVWKHVAVTLSGNTGILYVDGVEATRNANMTLKPSSLGLTDRNYIGKSQFDDPYLNGAVDELVIYNRTLTAQEVRGLASASSIVNVHSLGANSYAEGAD
ncbi:LamG domain-containing protein, partial [Paenibacillus sp. Aloe-11]|uniref:LamG domain-containing protein n=1 Tax=Paenibacillus sp. Aloe-11 TaxID=1050222 RepID=UPI00024F021D